MSTRCNVRGCPHIWRPFTLDWPWRCPEHLRDYQLAERLFRTALKRAERRTFTTATMKGQSA